VAHVVAVEAGATGEQAAQPAEPVERRAGSRKASSSRQVELAVGPLEPRPHGAGVGTNQQEVGQPPDGAGLDGHVGVEEKDEAALRLLQSGVVGLSEAHVHGEADHLGLAESRRHGVRGAIAGGVVDDDRLDRHVRAGVEGAQGVEQEVTDVIADDDCRDEWLVGRHARKDNGRQAEGFRRSLESWIA